MLMFLYPTFNEGKYWQESVNIPRVIFFIYTMLQVDKYLKNLLTGRALIVLHVSINVFKQMYLLLFGDYKYYQGDKTEMDDMGGDKGMHRIGQIRYDVVYVGLTAQLHIFFIPTLKRSKWSASRLSRFIRGETTPGTHI